MGRSRLLIALTVGGVAIAGVFRARRKDVLANRAQTTRAVTIRADAHALYSQWVDPAHLAAFFRGRAVEVVDDVAGKRYEWRLTKRRPYAGGGSLTLSPAPDDRGTEVRLALYLTGATARAATAFSRLHGAAPAQIAMESLRTFKATAEAGEAPVAAAQ
jgi:uncharacterized membrane protein